jgi:hypothetical protein
MSDSVWINNFEIIFKKDRLTEFFPTKEQTRAERINALVRLSLYIGLFMSLYYNDIKYMYIFIFTILITYIIYTEKNGFELETLENINSSVMIQDPQPQPKVCSVPTLDNPFMNATMKDYMNFDETGKIVDRPPACDINEPKLKKTIDTQFNNNLYRDVSDVFGKFNSQRQFYTMPSTTIPNAQGEFAKWLYLNPKTCKEDQDNCLNYEDIRGKRFIMPNPEQNPIATKK